MADGTLVIRAGIGAGGEHPLAEEVILGREHGSADLVLDDPGVSRRHAVVRDQGGRITVEDLGSSNGTFVNGERISGEVELAAADEIQLGGIVLGVESADAATALMAPGADATREHPGPVPRARPQPPPRSQPGRGPVPGRLAPHPTEEGNIPALAAAFLGPLSILLLVFSTGAAFFVSLPCAIAAIVLANLGVRKVDKGETGSHRAFANLGRITGIVGAVLSTFALVAFLVVTVALDATEDSLDGIVDSVREEIEGVDVPDAPDVNAPDVPSSDGGNDSGGVQAP
jgi:hypothetical protein